MRKGTITAVAGGTAVAVAVGGWFAVGTPGLGGEKAERVSVLTVATESPTPEPMPSSTPSATSSPTASPTPRLTPSPKPSPTASPTPKPSPTASPTPSPEAEIDPYATVMLKNGYGFCPCDIHSYRNPPPDPALSVSCVPPARLPRGKLVTIVLKVKNSSAKPVTFTELAGPRWVWLSLADDPGRTKDMNGGFADNAGHQAGGKGWWDDVARDGGAYQKAAGTLRQTVPANGTLTVEVLGSTVRTSNAKPLDAGPYFLLAGFFTAPGQVWNCEQAETTIG